MKKTVRIATCVTLALTLLLCTVWYFLVYDREFTKEILLSSARASENRGNHSLAATFYKWAYAQSGNSDEIAIELSQQYKENGNYTKAEYTLYNAIKNGGGLDVYIALSKLYIEQDKLLDAVTMLNNVTDENIKKQLDTLRPSAPALSHDPGLYNQYISISLDAGDNKIYYSTDEEYPSIKAEPYSEPIKLQDGENQISALAVGKNGLVSPLIKPGYTIGGVIELVNFSDAAIEAEVRRILAVDDDTPIYTNDLRTITEFSIPEGAKSYADIRHMIYLKKLTVKSGISKELKCLSYLSELTELYITDTSIYYEAENASDDGTIMDDIARQVNLTKLTLSSCGIGNITALSACTKISVLDLSHNSIRHIDAIASMASLTELYLQDNALNNLSVLSSCNLLTKINVSVNEITSLDPIVGLPHLKQITADSNQIAYLGEIGKMGWLTDLSISANKLTDVSQLSTCTNLENLNISANALTSIQPLSSLSKLINLNFSDNKVESLPTWSKDCALVTIDGSRNNIQSLDNLQGLEHLNVVTMDYNQSISSLKPLYKCPRLTSVSVTHTSVTDSDVKNLKGFGVNVSYK